MSNSSVDRGRAPLAPTLLGIAGVVPIIGLAIGILWGKGNVPVMSAALLSYGAIALSFLGGIRWGIAVAGSARPGQFLLSILPLLAGWGAVFLPLPLAYAVLGGAFCVWFVLEVLLSRGAPAPRWHMKLRGWLTLGAAVPLILLGLFWR